MLRYVTYTNTFEEGMSVAFGRLLTWVCSHINANLAHCPASISPGIEDSAANLSPIWFDGVSGACRKGYMDTVKISKLSQTLLQVWVPVRCTSYNPAISMDVGVCACQHSQYIFLSTYRH